MHLRRIALMFYALDRYFSRTIRVMRTRRDCVNLLKSHYAGKASEVLRFKAELVGTVLRGSSKALSPAIMIPFQSFHADLNLQ